MLRRLIAICAVVAVLSVLSGCASSHCRRSLEPLHATLLFDRLPGFPSASYIIHSQDWPSTVSGYRAPEVIFYRESIYDQQGGWSFNPNYYYRRFQMEKYGEAVR